MKDLKDYLERRNISVDDFQLHVDGFLLPMNKAELDEENKMAQQVVAFYTNTNVVCTAWHPRC